MTAAVGSRNFSEICCPLWFSKVPELERLDEKPSGDWGTVTVLKRDKNGWIRGQGLTPKKFVYSIEHSTGDLYGIQDQKKGLDTKAIVAFKSSAILIGNLFYTPFMISVNMLKIVIRITSIFWKTFPQLIRDFRNKGILAALGNATMDVMWQIPHGIFQDMWRIVRSPFYSIGMMFGATYGMIKPFEGRKWMAEIELNWHQGSTYRDDVRYHRTDEECQKIPFSQAFKEFMGKKVFYLGYCMQKRGNIRDRVYGLPRFCLFEEKPKAAEVRQKSLENGAILYTFDVAYNGTSHSIEIEKKDGVAWPRRLDLYLSKMPNKACIQQLIEEVKKTLGTDTFPAGSIDDFLGKHRVETATKSTHHAIKEQDEGKMHTISVEYNRIEQKIKIFEKEGNFQLRSFNLKPNHFPTLDAKESFMEDLRDLLRGMAISVRYRDENCFRQLFQDGQMGPLANVKYDMVANHG